MGAFVPTTVKLTMHFPDTRNRKSFTVQSEERHVGLWRQHHATITSITDYLSPLRLLIVTTVLLAVVEMKDLFLPVLFPSFAPLMLAVLDVLLLATLAVPILYFFLFRPMSMHVVERKRAEEALKQAQVQAERLAATEEVIAAVAHGIRNPLGNIRLVSQEMLEVLDPVAPLREPLGEIIEQVDVLEARLRSFLNTTKPFDVFLTSSPIAVLVDAAIEGIRQRVAKQGVTVSLDFDAAPALVSCDAVRIEEALQELLVNSIEAGADHISIAGQQGQDHMQQPWIRLTIEDNGTGVAPDAVDKIFRPFFTTKPLGTGLGLVAAKKIIEAHGGTLTLDTRHGRGTMATILLPCRTNQKQE